jgi:hypothetical protein
MCDLTLLERAKIFVRLSVPNSIKHIKHAVTRHTSLYDGLLPSK